jgi:hypothetical protein
MRSSTKGRGVLLAVAVVLLLSGYTLLETKKVVSTITPLVRIIDKADKESIEETIKNEVSYAFKVEENGSQFIEMYSGNLMKGKYDIDKKDFDTLELFKYYWFDIKYKKADVFESGIVRKVYTKSPLR